MQAKLVSINLTTYNRGHLLGRCLDSILSQSYNNSEIIIVDDASDDNTKEIVKNFQKNYNNINYFKHEFNKGNAFARNTALRNCNGYYVAFMDDDDEWIDQDKIKKQVNIFERTTNNRLALICTSVNLINKDGISTPKIIEKPKNLKNHILQRNGIIYSPTVLTKKEILEEVGGFDENLSRGVDSDFYRICIVKNNYDVYFMPEITVNIYEYGNNRITSLNERKSLKKNINANKYLIKKYFKYYIKHPSALIKRLKNIGLSYKFILYGK